MARSGLTGVAASNFLYPMVVRLNATPIATIIAAQNGAIAARGLSIAAVPLVWTTDLLTRKPVPMLNQRTLI